MRVGLENPAVIFQVEWHLSMSERRLPRCICDRCHTYREFAVLLALTTEHTEWGG